MTILVTGATGNVGRNVVKHLVAQQSRQRPGSDRPAAEPGQTVRALTRDPARARASLPEGVEVVAGDLTIPSTLESALDGVSALHLINFGGDYVPLETGAEIVALAAKAGVKRVTVLRGGVEGTVEKALKESTLDWTFIAPVEFMSGALDWAEEIRATRTVRAPFPGVKSAMVHDSDIGAVIACVLTQGGHGGKTYELTGPQALTVPDKVAAIAGAIGEPIKYVELTEAEARARWAAEGLPPEVVEFFVMAHGNPPAAAWTVLPTVEQITGRPALTLADWAAAHAHLFR